MARQIGAAKGGTTTQGQHDVNDVTGINNESADKLLDANRTSASGMAEIKAEVQAFSTQQFKEGMAALAAIKAARNMDEAMELQFRFARSFFDAYLQQARKLGELSFDLLQQNLQHGRAALAPIAAKVEATVGKFADHIAA